jgi:hypothetical protein
MFELESLGVSRVAEPCVTVHRIGYNACIPYSLRWITQFLSQQPSDVLKESSSAVPSHSPATSPPHDEDISVLPPPADATVSSALPLPHPETCGDLGAPTARNDQPSTRESQPRHESSPTDVSVTIADIPESPITVPPSSAPIPVPPRVQRTTTKLTLTELINQTREEHLRSHFVDLTDEVSPRVGKVRLTLRNLCTVRLPTLLAQSPLVSQHCLPRLVHQAYRKSAISFVSVRLAVNRAHQQQLPAQAPLQ